MTRVCPVATGTSLTLNISCPVQSGVAASTAAATTPHRQLRSSTRPIAATATTPTSPMTTTPRWRTSYAWEVVATSCHPSTPQSTDHPCSTSIVTGP